MTLGIEQPIRNLNIDKPVYELEGYILGNVSNTNCVVSLSKNTGGITASCERTNFGTYNLTLNKPILNRGIYTIIQSHNLDRSDMSAGEGAVTQFESVIGSDTLLNFMCWVIGESAGLTNDPINDAKISFTIKCYKK